MADLPTGEEVIVHFDNSDQNCDYIEFKERFLGVTFNFSNFSYIKETRKLCLNPKKTLENVTANPMMEKIDEERNPVELFDWVAANGKSILKRKTEKLHNQGSALGTAQSVIGLSPVFGLRASTPAGDSQFVSIIGTIAYFQFHKIPTHVFIFFPDPRSIC